MHNTLRRPQTFFTSPSLEARAHQASKQPPSARHFHASGSWTTGWTTRSPALVSERKAVAVLARKTAKRKRVFLFGAHYFSSLASFATRRHQPSRCHRPSFSCSCCRVRCQTNTLFVSFSLRLVGHHNYHHHHHHRRRLLSWEEADLTDRLINALHSNELWAGVFIATSTAEHSRAVIGMPKSDLQREIARHLFADDHRFDLEDSRTIDLLGTSVKNKVNK